MRNVFPGGTALLAGGMLVCAGVAAADAPGPAEVLRIKPSQANVLCDTPAQETWPKCRVEAVKHNGAVGYLMRDSRGLVVRKLMFDKDNKGLAVRAFYLNGQEVYREIDGDGDGRIDTYRWYNAGGTRHGLAGAQDGKIDSWKVLSAEEATAECVAALAARDWAKMQSLLLSDADVKELGLDEKTATRVTGEIQKATADFRALVSSIPADTKWQRFDGHAPKSLPGADAGAAKDVVLYHNGTIVTEAAGQALWLRAAEVVKVGDVWKLTGVPVIVDEKKPVETVGVLVPAISSQSAPTDIAGDSPVEASEEIQTLVAQLQKHDEAMPKDADAKTMVNYHRARHDLCAQIGKASKKLPNREHWYRQAADSIDAAVQTKAYPEGVEALEQYSEAFGKTSWGKKLSAYFKYRAINASFALRVDKEEHAKAQEKYVAELTEFVKAHPDSDDAADALWQLGNGMEFANKDGEALAHYKRLAKDHPKSQFAKKAEGAVRRIEAVGQQARWVGTGAGGYDLDTAQLRGKVVLVHYWATWCEPCKQEMPKIGALREKFGSKGLEVVGICLDANVEGATAFIKQARLEWPQLLEKGALDGELAVQYGVISLPTMMLVDEDGRVLHRNLQANTLDVEVEKALAKKIATKDK